MICMLTLINIRNCKVSIQLGHMFLGDQKRTQLLNILAKHILGTKFVKCNCIDEYINNEGF